MFERGLTWLFPRSFTARLLSVAFLGIHVPMLVLGGWLMFTSTMDTGQIVRVLVIVLFATLSGTAVTMLVLYRMLAPLRAATQALDDYYSTRNLPQLPDTGIDEVGRLSRGINRCIRSLDDGLRNMQEQAVVDLLTGALNRRGCEQALEQSLAPMAELPEPFMLFVVDMDNLKQINDGFGHAAGDAALVLLVESTREWLGQRDWVGRWGGDEFLIGVHGEQADVVARATRWMSTLGCAANNGGERAIEVSAGAAPWHDGQSPDALYRSADAAMYEAKFSGGGKLVVASMQRLQVGT
ncbi:MAG: diguanylate cyclase [Dokdonella sp.]